VDYRSDIYALGLLAFEMFTGKQPFRGESVFDMMTTRIKFDPPSPREINSQIHDEIAKLILRCLHRDPNDRYQNMAEVIVDLAAFFEKYGTKFELNQRPPRFSDVRVIEDMEIPSANLRNLTEKDPFLFAPVTALASLDEETAALVTEDVNVAKTRVPLKNPTLAHDEPTEQAQNRERWKYSTFVWISFMILFGVSLGRIIASLLGLVG
jgi:serine/threonine protein kinase